MAGRKAVDGTHPRKLWLPDLECVIKYFNQKKIISDNIVLGNGQMRGRVTLDVSQHKIIKVKELPTTKEQPNIKQLPSHIEQPTTEKHDMSNMREKISISEWNPPLERSKKEEEKKKGEKEEEKKEEEKKEEGKKEGEKKEGERKADSSLTPEIASVGGTEKADLVNAIAQSLDVLSNTTEGRVSDSNINNSQLSVPEMNGWEDRSIVPSLRHRMSVDLETDGQRSAMNDNHSDDYACHSFLSAAGDETRSSPMINNETQPSHPDEHRQHRLSSGEVHIIK